MADSVLRAWMMCPDRTPDASHKCAYRCGHLDPVALCAAVPAMCGTNLTLRQLHRTGRTASGDTFQARYDKRNA